ncbi:MAG: hypothetical protein AAF721_08660 [Myxococcota bacterium]
MGEPWPDAVEAIAFELDQAGYRASPGLQPESRSSVHLLLRRDATSWRLVLLDPARDLRLVATGPAVDAPATVGMHAVELVYASELADDAAANPRPPQPEARPIVRTTLTMHGDPRHSEGPEMGLAAGMPSKHRRQRRWGFSAGVRASTLGTLGARLGARRLWRRAEVGATVAGGAFARAEEDVGETSSIASTGRGFFSVGLEAAYVFRPARRFRPRLGVGSDLVVPIVTNVIEGAGFASAVAGDFDYDRNGPSAGLFWTPAARAGLELAVGPRLAIRASVGGGPVLTLRDIRIAGNVTTSVPRWSLAAAAGLAF